MAKYYCICGTNFRKEKDAKNHIEKHEKLRISCALSDMEVPHFYHKRDWVTRFCDWSLDWYSPFWWRTIGFLALHSVFVWHFRYDVWESLISGLALGIVIGTTESRKKNDLYAL